MAYEIPLSPPRELPDWEAAVLGVLAPIRVGLHSNGSGKNIIRYIAQQSLRDRSLNNLGEMEQRLRQRDAFARLVAVPFKPISGSLHCIDMQTLEPRSHWLGVAVGKEEIDAKLGNSPEHNEALLAKMTGFLVEMVPAESAPNVQPRSSHLPEGPVTVVTLGADTPAPRSLIRVVSL